MEEICFSETPDDFQQTTRCHIPEDWNLHNHRSENLKSYKIYDISNTEQLLLRLMSQSQKIPLRFIVFPSGT
jgi:hypothetical protein